MSFTDDYLEEKKKKKKKTTAAKTGHSFTDNYLSEREKSQALQEDIAPVRTTVTTKKKEDAEEERTWFKSGAFDDGYQFGDVTKTIIGTLTDTSENLATGVLGMGERVVDAGAYLAGGVGKMFGADDFAEDTEKFIKKDLYDEAAVARKIVQSDLIERVTGIDEDDSIFGEKSDSLIQSAGQLGATIGLQAVGVPWFVTSGVTGFGGEVENALNQGATFGQAGMSAAISAGAEVLTEKLFGGSGLGEKGLIAVDALTKGISSKIVKALADYGVDIAAEGAEEVISQFASNLGSSLYREEKMGEILFSEEAIDEYIESAIGGGVLGGVMNASNMVNSARTGKDYRSGLSENEQKVVQKEVENRIAEREKDGKTLSKQEKAAIEEQVQMDLEKGYISVDTIEEVLGGETFKTYQNTVKHEDSLRETFNQLNQMKQGDMTGEQIDLRNELKEQLKEIESKGERNQLKSQLGSEVMSLVKGDRLIESYNERSRRGQAFEADLTKYNEKQKAVVQKAAESGVLNNTRRTHEFVDMIAKISADKGVLFDFTNNEKLKGSSFAVDGKTVNGFVTKDGVTLNIDSAKSLNSVVGHEITHVLEGTELYTELQNVLKSYAETKGEYQTRYDSLKELYKDIEGANIDAELTADLVGDYLFTDPDFINNLSANNRNVFQKIYDEVKYLCKVATAGSKEARELEKVKRAFEKAYKAEGKAESGTKYSVSDSTGKKLTKEQQEYFKDTKVRDFDGNLKIMYQGGNGDFTVFDRKKSKPSNLYGRGFYFTDSESHAKQYGNARAFYLDIKNPVPTTERTITEDQMRNFLEAVAENEDDYSFENYGYGATVDSVLDSVYSGKSDFAMLYDVSQTAIGDMVEAVELFNEVNGTDFDGLILDTETVTFRSNQAKLTDNLNPTSDPDIRFSMSESVEETKDLMALHNLQSSELIKTLDLGGLPMPSIAVIKAEAGHDQYGDVSLILPKDTIDPEANKDNKVYGGDAWTPVYPKIEYKPNEKVAKKISNKYYGLAKEIGYDAVRPMYSYVNELEDTLNRAGGEAAMLEKLYEDTDMMNVYLQDSGKGKVEPIVKETVTEISDVEAEMNQFLIDAMGEDLVKAFKAPAGENPMKYRVAFMEQHESKIRDAYKRYFMEVHGFTAEEADNALSNTSMRGLMKIMREAYMYTQNKGVTVKTETDYNATREAIRNAAADGYKEWVDSLFKGVEGKSGIRNNQDYYTRSGNPRSWDALHWENTLENVVKTMRGQEDTGAGSFSPYNSFASLSHKRYGSIAEIKADSNRLRKMPEDEYEALNESFSKRFSDIANSIKDPAERNQFMALDHAAELITDAVSKQKTKNGMLNYLRKWNSRVTEQTVDDVLTLVSDIANMPTGYFEAKPKRAVGFEEVGVFVIPNNIDVNVKQELLNRGYSIAEYDPNVEGDRTKVLNQFEEYKFSLSDAGAQSNTYGNYNVYGKDIALSKQGTETSKEISKETQAESKVPFAESEEVAPVSEEVVAENATTTMFPDDLAPMDEAYEEDRIASLDDADMPPETEAPYYEESEELEAEDPFEERDWYEVSNRKVKAYMYDHPEVKPFFQAEAAVMLDELNSTTKGEKWFNDHLYYESGGEEGFGGTKRHTSDSIATMLDEWRMSYADIEKGLQAIIEDHGAENIAAAKKVEFMLNERLLSGYKSFTGYEPTMDRFGNVPQNQEYINMLAESQIVDAYSKESFDALMAEADSYAPPVEEDIAPVPMMAERNPVLTEAYEAIRPKREKQPKLIRVDSADSEPSGKQRKWVKTSTESEAVDGKILPDDLDQKKINYQPIPNKVTLGKANSRLDSMGYEAAVTYFNSQFANKSVSLEDVALGERLIQEAIKRGDNKTAGELIQNVSILGTELGQKVQALSIIKRLTPEGQLGMIQKTVERGKTKGDKSFEGVEVTQDMIDKILSAYNPDGTYDQTVLNEMVEDVKQQIADKMKVTDLDKVNAWRYLSMLGNPKTHIRNLVSNVAMRGTMGVKNALARTVESVAPISSRTKTWKSASEDVKNYASRTATEMKDIISGENRYDESAGIKQKRTIFKNKILNGVYEFNSDMLGKEDWWFSKATFTSSLSEFLTANGINTAEDIKRNPEIVDKARQYALEQSQIATFRQYSWLANKINEIERRNTATNIAVGAIVPFKKTPINIAKTGLSYSPLGFAKTLTYDMSQVKKGDMEASEMIDHLAQNVTGSALALVGYMLAQSGLINGAGDDDKEGDYDYQLGKQAYSVNIGGATYSLSWLSPVAMPLFVGANAYEQLVEGKEWNGDVVVETLAQTLDPLSEMSFISSLDSVLSSYDSGIQKFAGIGETMAQNYITQFAPTLMSQVATVMDDTKRSTKVSGDSDFKFVEQTINKLKYKIPFLRETLEPTTDIWGNEVKQTENVMTRAFETFLAPYAKRDSIATEIDDEIKELYAETGDTGLIPSIPYNYVNYDGEKYKMSAADFTEFKKNYGQTAVDLMDDLFATYTYQNADSEARADMVNRVYDYARDEARREYFAKYGVDFTNSTEDGEEVYKPNSIKGAIENDMTPDEYSFYAEYPEKYKFFNENGISYETYKNADEDGKRAYTWAYENPGKFTMSKAISDDFMEYYGYKSDMNDFDAKDENGETVSGLKKERVLDYINGLDLDYGQKIILYRSMYDSKADRANYNMDIIDYLNSRDDISYEEMETILKELGFTVDAEGNISWD